MYSHPDEPDRLRKDDRAEAVDVQAYVTGQNRKHGDGRDEASIERGGPLGESASQQGDGPQENRHRRRDHEDESKPLVEVAGIAEQGLPRVGREASAFQDAMSDARGHKSAEHSCVHDRDGGESVKCQGGKGKPSRSSQILRQSRCSGEQYRQAQQRESVNRDRELKDRLRGAGRKNLMASRVQRHRYDARD